MYFDIWSYKENCSIARNVKKFKLISPNLLANINLLITNIAILNSNTVKTVYFQLLDVTVYSKHHVLISISCSKSCSKSLQLVPHWALKEVNMNKLSSSQQNKICHNNQDMNLCVCVCVWNPNTDDFITSFRLENIATLIEWKLNIVVLYFLNDNFYNI